jgi:hypothetical protein
MPLRDLFHPPVSKRASWQGFHGLWPGTIVQELAPRLPLAATRRLRVDDRSRYYPPIQLIHRTAGTARALRPDVHSTAPTYGVTCRKRRVARQTKLDAGSRPLAIGQPLPSLPVWLSETQTVSLDLEASYEETCRVLRIP